MLFLTFFFFFFNEKRKEQKIDKLITEYILCLKTRRSETAKNKSVLTKMRLSTSGIKTVVQSHS